MGAGRGRSALPGTTDRHGRPEVKKLPRDAAIRTSASLRERQSRPVRIRSHSGHIAEQSDVLMPSDPKARARTTAWMFAALNSVEPHIQNLTAIDLVHADQDLAE